MAKKYGKAAAKKRVRTLKRKAAPIRTRKQPGKNPQDATRRNVQAGKRRDEKLLARVRDAELDAARAIKAVADLAEGLAGIRATARTDASYTRTLGDDVVRCQSNIASLVEELGVANQRLNRVEAPMRQAKEPMPLSHAGVLHGDNLVAPEGD